MGLIGMIFKARLALFAVRQVIHFKKHVSGFD